MSRTAEQRETHPRRKGGGHENQEQCEGWFRSPL